MKRRRHKYGVAAKEDRQADGITFASRKEMLRYLELKLMVRAGAIRNLKLQPRFKLEVNGIHVCTYVADFQYEERRGDFGGDDYWPAVVEDVKGIPGGTDVYKLKKNLMRACLGIEIRET